MNPYLKSFQNDSITYTINRNDANIIFQIIKTSIPYEQSYSIEQLKDISPIFHMSTLNTVYDDLISAANKNRILFKESSGYFIIELDLNVNKNETFKVELVLSKQENASQSIGEQFLMKDINKHFEKINARLDSIDQPTNSVSTKGFRC